VSSPFRFAICNEVFGQTDLVEVCAQVAKIGYDGLEIAPFTLGSEPAQIDSAARVQISENIHKAGLSFVGLHWLLVGPEGLHATARDESVRERTWNYVHQLIDLCADLARPEDEHKGVMVFGSPKQREARDGMSPKEASDVFVHGLAHAAPHAESRGVTILVEALPLSQCNVVTTLADAASIVRQIGSPAVQTMFDVHNAVDETEPHSELVRRYASHIRHVHVNEMDGREPGMGNYDFESLLHTLSDLNYTGWVSLEAFDFSRAPTEIAQRAIDRLRQAARHLSEVNKKL
jgi:D-psicose/D-tagatose/L-ribulose 3-epimerase